VVDLDRAGRGEHLARYSISVAYHQPVLLLVELGGVHSDVDQQIKRSRHNRPASNATSAPGWRTGTTTLDEILASPASNIARISAGRR
jgi:hypothetical protein